MPRKKYIVKPGIQLKCLIVLWGFILIGAALCYYAVLSHQSAPGAVVLGAGAGRAYMNMSLWIVFAFAAAALLCSIFYFHRIIGPLFFFEKVMQKLAGGNFAVKMHCRKKDETKELADLIGQVIENTKTSVLEDRQKVKEAVEAIDAGNNEKAKDILSSVTKWCKTEADDEDK